MKRRILVAVTAAALVVALFGFGPNAEAQYNSPTGERTELRIAEEFNAGPTLSLIHI